MFDFDFSDMLIQAITVSSPTVTKGTNIPGAVKSTWTAVYSDVPASIQPMTGDQRTEFGKLDIDVDFEMVTNQVLTLVNGYRVNDGADNYVIKHWENQGGRGEVFAIYAKRINE